MEIYRALYIKHSSFEFSSVNNGLCQFHNVKVFFFYSSTTTATLLPGNKYLTRKIENYLFALLESLHRSGISQFENHNLIRNCLVDKKP